MEHCPLCPYVDVPIAVQSDPRATVCSLLCANDGHASATRYCLCTESTMVLCEQCYAANHQGHTWMCLCTRGDREVMYSRREKIKRVREVIEKLESTALQQISKAELDVHKALSDVLDAVNYEAHKMLGKLEQSREIIKELIESLCKLQMQDPEAKVESPDIFHELCMRRDVRLTDEMFSCVQFAMDCESDDMKRGAKGWWKQMVNVRLQIPESLVCLGKDRSFCAGCQRQTNTLGSFLYRHRRITLPCGHYFHNRDCLVLYMTSASRGFYYSKPIYRCPECWSILDAASLMPDLAKKGRSVKKCCMCNRPEGELFRRKQPGHYLCEACADMGGLADCRSCPCGKFSIYSEDRASSFAE